MELKIHQSDDICFVAPALEKLDASNSGTFKSNMIPIVEESKKIVLDMSSLSFIDSAGLASLLSCLRMSVKNDGEIKLCNLTNQVRALFELVRMHQIFEIFNDTGEASRSFSAA